MWLPAFPSCQMTASARLPICSCAFACMQRPSDSVYPHHLFYYKNFALVSWVGRGSWSSPEEKKAQRGGPRKNCLRKVHSLHCAFFLMHDESNQWWGKGSRFRVTSPSRQVDVALGIYLPQEETVFSTLSTLQAHSRFIHTILGSGEEGPPQCHPAVRPTGNK